MIRTKNYAAQRSARKIGRFVQKTIYRRVWNHHRFEADFRRRTWFENCFSSINFRRTVFRENAKFFNRFFAKPQFIEILFWNAIYKRRKSANGRCNKTMDSKNNNNDKTRVSILHKKNPSRFRKSNRTFVWVSKMIKILKIYFSGIAASFYENSRAEVISSDRKNFDTVEFLRKRNFFEYLGN